MPIGWFEQQWPTFQASHLHLELRRAAAPALLQRSLRASRSREVNAGWYTTRLPRFRMRTGRKGRRTCRHCGRQLICTRAMSLGANRVEVFREPLTLHLRQKDADAVPQTVLASAYTGRKGGHGL